MAAPLASIAGTTAAVAAVLTDGAAWAVPGAAVAGAPGILHLLRRRRRERKLADRRARAMSRPVPPLVWEPVALEPVVEDLALETVVENPVVEQSVIDAVTVEAPVVEHALVEHALTEHTVAEAPVVPQPVVWGDVLEIRDVSDAEQDDHEKVDDVTPAALSAALQVPDGRVDTGELQAIWDAGDGPDTGELPVVPDAPVVVGGELVTEAPEGKQAVLVGGLTGTTQVLAPMLRRRSRASTMEDRVFDALAMSMADPLTRALRLPSGKGRRAADARVDLSVDVPAEPVAERSLRALPSRKGRHVA